MKPNEFLYPFNWEERRPHLDGKLLFVPEYYDQHESFGPLDLNTIFGNKNPVYIEYCSGNGQWIIGRALENPNVNWIAVEKQFGRAKQIFKKAKSNNLQNLFIVTGEALTFTRYYLRDNIAEKSFVNFPDPWPKDRHAKHRLITPSFAKELTRILNPKGISLFVTDHPLYAEQMVAVMQGEEKFSACHPAPYFVIDRKGYGASFFKDLWNDLGRTIHYIEYSNGC
ncbi:MAG: tRNA (guanosine(46)-N7)-methyltransferase TrmB [Candidatus Algichlamydia australiensis]|nr:tRNA (guanosine(46)-N7)-methyltransferase TrmB [Chlamydiales bacterium]